MPGLVAFEGGKGGYVLFSAGGCDFVLAGMGHYLAKNQEAMDFLTSTYDHLPDRVGILVTHSLLHSIGNRGAEGPLYYANVISKCANIRLCLAGNMRGVGRRVDAIDDDGDGTPDRTVNQMLANYQGIPLSKQGYLRILTFDPADHSISVVTYNPVLDDYNYFDDEKETFVLEDAF